VFGTATKTQLGFWPTGLLPQPVIPLGFRTGDKGTQTSRTMMLNELTTVLTATQRGAKRADYTEAIIASNCLAKPTASTRRLTNQRLGELYALDPTVPLFRILRSLWEIDQLGRPLLAVLVALARDPLFMATASSVIPLPDGAEFLRDPMTQALRSCVGSRLNDSILDKVVRNASSSWTQSGHLVGRTFKRRRHVSATSAAVTFALYIAYYAGFRGSELLTSGWINVLDCGGSAARDLAFAAKRQGLLDLRIAGDVVEVSFGRLESLSRRAVDGAH